MPLSSSFMDAFPLAFHFSCNYLFFMVHLSLCHQTHNTITVIILLLFLYCLALCVFILSLQLYYKVLEGSILYSSWCTLCIRQSVWMNESDLAVAYVQVKITILTLFWKPARKWRVMWILFQISKVWWLLYVTEHWAL